MKIILCSALISSFGLIGCSQVIPPATPPTPTPKSTYVKAPFDAVWSAVVEYFADTRIPIQTIDKASGIIASKGFELGPELRLSWMDCGTAGGKPLVEQANDVMKANADFNVFVRPTGDSTEIRLNVGMNGSRMTPFAGNQYTEQKCISNGKFEEGLLARIAQRSNRH
jgi:hypothetical protein